MHAYLESSSLQDSTGALHEELQQVYCTAASPLLLHQPALLCLLSDLHASTTRIYPADNSNFLSVFLSLLLINPVVTMHAAQAFLVCKTDMQLADISKLNHLLEANPQMCPRYQRPLESDGGQPCHGNLKDIMTLSMAIDIAIDHVVSALRRPYSHVDSIVLERTAREAVVSVGDCFMYDDMVDLSYEGSHCPALANPLSPQDLAMPCYPYSRPRAARGSSLHQVTCLEPTMSMEAACPQQQSPGQDAMSGPKTNHQGRGTQLYSLPRAYTHPLESKDKLECPKGAA